LQNNSNSVWEGDLATTGTLTQIITAEAENSLYQLSINQKSSNFYPLFARHVHGKQYELSGNVLTVVAGSDL
jgi:hypothetical protein